MKKESREFYYDEDLQLEAYQFQGIMQPFPNHFHEYYVIGFIEKGKRKLICKGSEYHLYAMDIVLFNPKENHDCAPLDHELLDYRALNIPVETMCSLCKVITGNELPPSFLKNVIRDEDAVFYLQRIHQMIIDANDVFEKEECLYFLIAYLLDKYSTSSFIDETNHHKEVESALAFMNAHFQEHIDLKQLCQMTAMSSSTLLRAFTKEKGITPYRYLEVTRINKAKEFLESGMSVLDAATSAGFFDQSHFSNFFRSFIGISPGAYRSIFIKDKEKLL